jgi:ComF family protein
MCGGCIQKPPYFDEVISAFLYEYPLKDLIYRFKNAADMKTGKALSELFLESLQSHYLQQHLAWPDYVVPVPLDWRKQWQRGFNQSFVLGETIVRAQKLEWFLDVKRLGFRKKLKEQKRLSRRNRQKNVKNSFEITQKLNGESVAIIDDVMTTGTTVNSFAKALKEAGAGKVSVWALARTPLQ